MVRPLTIKPIVMGIFCCLFISMIHGQERDSLIVYFEINAYTLLEAQKDSIRNFITKQPATPGKILRIKGSADYLGNPASNQILSDQRVYTVSQFVRNEFPESGLQIKDRSLGEIPFKGKRTAAGKAGDRTVKLYFETELTVGNLDDLGNLPEGSLIRLGDLHFYGGRHILLPESIPVLKEIEQKLKENRWVHIEIQGHVCCMGGLPQPDGLDLDTKEYKLSLNRAKNIYEYLVRNGIDSSRLSYIGYGYAHPLVTPEKTEEEKTLNRRVELRIAKSENK